MAEKTTEELNEMTADEIQAYLEGDVVEETEEVVEEVKEEIAPEEAPAAKPEENESPFYRGKTREEIIRLHEETNRYTSRQDTIIHELKSEIEKVKTMVSAKPVEVEEPVEEELDGRYEEEDVKVIRKIAQKEAKRMVREELESIEQSKKQQTEAERRAAINENETFWKILEKTNPVAYKEVQADVIAEIQRNVDETLHRPGWLQNYFTGKITAKSGGNGHKPVAEMSTVDRKLKAVTVSGGSNAPTRTLKSIEEMSADEYRDYMKSQGTII